MRSMPAFQVSGQRGFVLFIALVVLLIMTVVGVSAINTTSLEQRMARNTRDSMLAFHAAEVALSDAERFIDGLNNVAAFSDTGDGGLWTAAGFGEVQRWEIDGVFDGGQSVPAATPVQGVAAQPRYIVEYVTDVVREENANAAENTYGARAAVDRVRVFRVTARGVGGSATARVLLQTTYGRIID